MTWCECFQTGHSYNAIRTVRYDTIRYDTIRYADTIRYDTRHDTTRHGTTRHDTTRHDTIRYDAIQCWQALQDSNVVFTRMFCPCNENFISNPFNILGNTRLTLKRSKKVLHPLAADFCEIFSSGNKSKFHLLNKAGDVAARLFRPSEDGFMVKTTCKLFMTYQKGKKNKTFNRLI